MVYRHGRLPLVLTTYEVLCLDVANRHASAQGMSQTAGAYAGCAGLTQDALLFTKARALVSGQYEATAACRSLLGMSAVELLLTLCGDPHCWQLPSTYTCPSTWWPRCCRGQRPGVDDSCVELLVVHVWKAERIDPTITNKYEAHPSQVRAGVIRNLGRPPHRGTHCTVRATTLRPASTEPTVGTRLLSCHATCHVVPFAAPGWRDWHRW